MTTITNCIPIVYKHFKFINVAIENILHQTLLPNEVIVIISQYQENEEDNNILKSIELQLEDKNIKFIYKTFPGVQYAGKNREIAYNLCNTELIIYQDGDDFTHKKRNETFCHIYNNTKCPHLLHGWTSNKNALNELIDIDKIKILPLSSKGHHTHNGAICLSKSLIGPINFPNNRRGQDVQLNLMLCRKYKSQLIINNYLYIYNKELSSIKI